MITWNRIKWCLRLFISWRTIHDKFLWTGRILIVSSVGLPALNVTLKFTGVPYLSQLTLGYGNGSIVDLLISITSLLLGVVLIIVSVVKEFSNARGVSKVKLVGMTGSSDQFPNHLLNFRERMDAREVVELGCPEANENSIQKQIELYNSEISVGIYKRFILNENCHKIFLGGLARVPFLVAYGACFRAVSAKIVFYENSHNGGEEFLLDDEEKGVTWSVTESYMDVDPNDKGEIGIVICLSTNILLDHLPTGFDKNCIFFKPKGDYERNYFRSQDDLVNFSEDVRRVVEGVSANVNVSKVHFFLSVQSTLGLELGRRYQEGTQKDWVISNYDGSSGTYNWAIELTKNGINKKELI